MNAMVIGAADRSRARARQRHLGVLHPLLRRHAVPVFVAGEAADRFGLQTVTVGYFMVLAFVVGGALLLSRRAVPGSGS